MYMCLYAGVVPVVLAERYRDPPGVVVSAIGCHPERIDCSQHRWYYYAQMSYYYLITATVLIS